MSESSGPGADAENVDDIKSARIRSANSDDGIDAVPPKTKKANEVIDNADEETENSIMEERDFEEDDVVQEDTDFGEEEEEEDVEEVDDDEDDIEDGLEENQLDETGESSDLDEFIQSNLAEIEGCQSDIEALNKKANDEILKVEQKYNKLRQPVYTRRNTYINKIPGFWVTVFSRHPQLKRVLSKDDIKCLRHLTTLQIDDFEDSRSGYRIKFSFSKNQWFSNSLITKEYNLPWNDSPSCACTTINWFPGMNLTKTQSSFFSWFCSQDDASTDDIAEIIKEELWPGPLQFYMMRENGEVDSEESDDEEAVYVEDEDEDAEYISSEDEEEWNEYKRQPAFGKEAPGSSKRDEGDEEDADYGAELDDEEGDDVDQEEFAEENGSEDDSRPDPIPVNPEIDSDVTNSNHGISNDVSSSDDLHTKEISSIPVKPLPVANIDAADEVSTTVEGET